LAKISSAEQRLKINTETGFNRDWKLLSPIEKTLRERIPGVISFSHKKKLEPSNILAFYQPQLNGICPQRSGIMQVQFFHQVGTGFFNGF
jgi:hypothetical protein